MTEAIAKLEENIEVLASQLQELRERVESDEEKNREIEGQTVDLHSEVVLLSNAIKEVESEILLRQKQIGSEKCRHLAY